MLKDQKLLLARSDDSVRFAWELERQQRRSNTQQASEGKHMQKN
jgi:hypothetical protein